ncbi:MAG: GAF domain-containing sensor histidine kinase [FCB group bacterium]|jgi:signal transduction histidine kinase|nr:GAF domain-containing sensor histidine kinase [FCB group bacterium]
MGHEEAEHKQLLDITAKQLRELHRPTGAEIFERFASPLIEKLVISKITLLAMDGKPKEEDRVVTGYALETSSATPLQPKPLAGHSVLGNLLADTPREEVSCHFPDTASVVPHLEEGCSAFYVHVPVGERSSLHFVFSRFAGAPFTEAEQTFLSDYCRHLSPFLASVLELALPSRTEARRRFRTRLRNEARGKPQDVIDKVACLWRELFEGCYAVIWLYNDLSRAFILSGYCKYTGACLQSPECAYQEDCEQEAAPQLQTISADESNPETRCHGKMEILRLGVDDFPESRKADFPAHMISDVLCVPLLYKPPSPEDAQEQCLGVIDVFLTPGGDWHHDLERLRELAQNTGFAIQESFEFQRREILRAFNDLVSRTLGSLTTTTLKDLKAKFFQGLIEIIKTCLNVYGVSIFEATDDEEAVVCIATTGLENVIDITQARYRKGEGATGKIFQTGKPLIDPDANLADADSVPVGRFVEKTSRGERDIPFLGVPIKAGDKVIGVLRCVEKLSAPPDNPLPFSYHDLDDLVFIAEQLTPIMEMLKSRQRREYGISVALHDVRSPAATLRDAAHDLQRELKRLNVPKKIQQKIDDLYGTCLSLLTNVNMAGRAVGADFKPILQKINLETSIVARLKAMLHPQAVDAGITISFAGFESLPRMYVDPGLFEQMLFNLMVNAIKYSFTNTDVEIFAEELRMQGQPPMVRMRVRNWGEPIPHREKELIFQAFYRGSTGTRMGPGQGLGLFSARKIIEAHGGSICVSRLDSPTEFTIEFPLREEIA